LARNRALQKNAEGLQGGEINLLLGFVMYKYKNQRFIIKIFI
jgi:hypothetical protein